MQQLSDTYKFWNDAMEGATFVAVALLVCAQLTEVFCSLWHHVGAQQHDNAPGIITTNTNVEKHLWIALLRFLNYCWSR